MNGNKLIKMRKNVSKIRWKKTDDDQDELAGIPDPLDHHFMIKNNRKTNKHRLQDWL